MQIDAAMEFVLLLVKIRGVPPLGEGLLEILADFHIAPSPEGRP